MRWLVVILIVFIACILIFIGVGLIYSSNDSANEILSEPQDSECILRGCTSSALYVGSINSDKYYKCGCFYADRINPENIICFDTDLEATNQGYQKIEDCS